MFFRLQEKNIFIIVLDLNLLAVLKRRETIESLSSLSFQWFLCDASSFNILQIKYRIVNRLLS